MSIADALRNYYRRSMVAITNQFLTGQNEIVTNNQELIEIVKTATRSDISDHLPTLFIEALTTRGQTMVELGTRGGESTFALEKAAKIKGTTLVSVDIEGCDHEHKYENWIFVKKDDLLFANEFEKWSEANGLDSKIDFLFIDTSHEYDHTKKEIKSWFPLLNTHAKVAFHDTNMSELYTRADGSKGLGWHNDRGVIRAIEEYLNVRFNEKKNFQTVMDDWVVRHWHNCNGLTILEKI